MSNITGLLDNGYDDIVTFARVMYDTLWRYHGPDAGENLLAYFESPHKWDAEHAKWQEFGGTLDQDCLNAFENWYDHKDDPEDGQ